MNELLSVPVSFGQELQVNVTGKAKTDFYHDLNGFIIFLEGIPEGKHEGLFTVRVNLVKKNYAKARYVAGGEA